MRRRLIQTILTANKQPNAGVRNLGKSGRPASKSVRGPSPRPLAPGDPVAVLGNQPLVNVIETSEDYTMAQDDLAVIAQGPLTITLAPNALTATPVIVISDTGTTTVDGPIQGGPQSVPQGKIGFFSYSPLSGTWSVNIDGCEGQVVVAPNYYIDSIHGSDENPGTKISKPLKTWQQLQNIFGRWSTLPSVGGNTPATQGLVTVTLLNDLPNSDPITFYNYL